MQSSFSMAGKSVSLIAIEDSFPSFMSSGVTMSCLRKLEKCHQSKSLEQISWKCLVNLRSHRCGFEGYGEKHNWTHKSCFWKLHYAKALILPHNIDLMHQERNVTESIISMHFDVTGFSEDNVNARKDLANLCNRLSMEPEINAKGI
jgi:hypothetical protein